MTPDLKVITQWANHTGHKLRFTFHPSHIDVCPNGTWDLTVKPGRNGADHTHFAGEDLTTAVAQLANDYGLPDTAFSLELLEARAWDRKSA